jgi:hypothetical protein
MATSLRPARQTTSFRLLRNKMHTLVVTDDQGLTDPTFFKSGLTGYIEDCGYSADMNSYGHQTSASPWMTSSISLSPSSRIT